MVIHSAFANYHLLITKSLRSFCTVFTSAPLTAGYAGTIQNAANDVIAHTRQISDAASTNHDHAVLLKVVVDARDVSGNFLAVSQSNPGDFS
jgi:hypothetical protein